ncbi:excinuclease ABC subunit C [Allocatelliglobosispora scoriae]|uniref:Excinuclease ABC subunit C n=1 Tax=Allocatelliglobosispora scoriae TaxID=643052 RepID=A0A841BDV0_9ACTN|nr:GIY-YIG nuclease family protein [Allocatelliglobosispora scoriae]MBB5867277.1 excinuclease ABC subunit C [Allocatelliglobosispora scoriae]
MSTVPRSAVAGLPSAPGVYRFRDDRGRALYIGRAVDLRRRVGSYWGDLGDRRHLRRMVPQIAAVEAVACDSAHEAAWLERNLLQRSKPRWNRVRGGAEVPVYLHLDRRPGSARLSVVHRPPTGPVTPDADHPVGLFGPYLGGTQARLAVSALERVLPLSYADDRLSGGQQDMARARGLAALDRAALLTTVTAVLQRQPDAVETVKHQLAEHRTRASDSLAFELAARIQQQIEAVDWIVAEQKVTTLAPTDCDVYGWADGLLVQFEIRQGRMCVWKQRACPSAGAQRYLERTPPEWRAFAARSAELASLLHA